MTTDNPLPTPPSASTSATPVSAPASATAASASQTTDPAVAAPTAPGQPASAAQQQQQQQQQQQPSPAEVIELLLQQIVASNNEAALATTLLNSLGTPDARESILASVTPAGEDPLDALDAARHTIGVLFILCVVVFFFFFSYVSLSLSFLGPHCTLLLRWNAGCAQSNGVADLFMPCSFLVVYLLIVWFLFFFFFGSIWVSSALPTLRQVCTSRVHNNDDRTCSLVRIHPELLPEFKSRSGAPCT